MAGETVPLFLRVPPVLKDQVVALAKARGLSVNAEGILALSEHVAVNLLIADRRRSLASGRPRA